MNGLPQPVLVVGTGLIGTSLALSLRRRGVEVWLTDRDPQALAVAVSRAAGRAIAPGGPAPSLVVVAVPPAGTAAAVAEALRAYPDAVVTDVASVKVPILRALAALDADTARYVGGHPMAGREMSGPAAARADLIDDRPWVIAVHPDAAQTTIDAVQELALTARALPVVMPAAEHDQAVAVVSHTPQVLASLLAARLVDSSDAVVSIAGQGLRDMTRIAASDPELWVEILSANASQVAGVLAALRADLDDLLEALGSVEQGGQDVLAGALRRGNAGRDRVPGKHGALTAPTTVVPVAVQDRPGELGRLFAAVAEAGFSIEDVRIEHVLGRPTGVVQMTVGQVAAQAMIAALVAGGWDVRA
ncbi:MAG: prephenate dehydrogenase [Candidatus Nanopelagicales bacterium]